MDSDACINHFQNFIKDNRLIAKSGVLEFDFQLLAKRNPKLSQKVLDDPENSLGYLSIAYKNIHEIEVDISPYNLPRSEEVPLKRLRAKHINKLLSVRAIIMSKSQVAPITISARFECPSCGNIQNVLQRGPKFREPSRCGCGRKGRFRLLEKEKVDFIHFSCEDLPENLKPSEQPGRLLCEAMGPIVKGEEMFPVAGRVLITGILEERPIQLRTGGQSTKSDFIFKILNMKNLELFSFDGAVTEEEADIHKVIRQSHNPAAIIRQAIFPDHVGDEAIIEAMIYQQFAGDSHNGTRDFFHILLVGEKALGKSAISQKAAQLNPISKFATGPDLSKVGLTIASVKDPYTKALIPQAGILPKANGGCAWIDEIEKLDDEHKKGLHTPMADGICYKNVAGIDTKLVSQTSILATANPKVVNSKDKVVNSKDKVVRFKVNLVDTLVSRFDLIFQMFDRQDPTLDGKIATSIFERTTSPSENTTCASNLTTCASNLTTLFSKSEEERVCIIKNYIYLCKNKKKSIPFSRRLGKHTTHWYISAREQARDVSWEHKSIDPRSLVGLIILARAIARAKWADSVTIDHFKLANRYFSAAGLSKEKEIPEETVE